MNMLSSLKALLFTSTSVVTPTAGEQVDGSGVPVVDFAQLFEGSIADAAPAPAAAPALAPMPIVAPTPVPTVAPMPTAAPLSPVEADAAPQAHTELPPVPAGGETPAPPETKNGSQTVRRAAQPTMPSGLVLALVNHAATSPAVQSDEPPTAIAPAVQPVTSDISEPEQEPPVSQASTPDLLEPSEQKVALPEAEDIIPKKGEPKADRLAVKAVAKPEQAPPKATETEAAETTDEAAPKTAHKIKQPSEPVAPSAPTMPIAAVVEPKAVPVEQPATKDAAPAPAALVGERPAAVASDRPLKPVPPAPLADLPPQEELSILVAEAAPVPEPDAVPHQPAPTAGENKPAAPVRQPAPIMAAGKQFPEIPDNFPAPVLNGKPVKAEALSLLQIVREQVAARQAGEPIGVREQVAAAASARPLEAKPAVEALVALPAASPPSDNIVSLAAAPSQPAGFQPISPAVPMVDISATLGAQVVDMGVSGQWIDGLARDIAGLSAHGAQGRFHLNTDQLGSVQVDIQQGSEGAAVSLTVASEAAELALRQDSDRLKLDTGLAAVRIAEVKIERAVPEAGRSDSTGQQSPQQQSQQQHSSSQPHAPWQNQGQAMGQSPGQQGRWQGRENNGFDAKSSGDPAVLNHADARREAGEPQRARYA